jgi:hypothetical protein
VSLLRLVLVSFRDYAVLAVCECLAKWLMLLFVVFKFKYSPSVSIIDDVRSR